MVPTSCSLIKPETLQRPEVFITNCGSSLDMYSKRVRGKKMREALEKNIIEKELSIEKTDSSMYDYPMVDHKDPFKNTEQHLKSIIQQSQTEKSDSDIKYIVLERTEDDVEGVVENGKKDSIDFFNPIKDSAQFQRVFYKGRSNLVDAMPFHFQEKNLVSGVSRPTGCKVHSNKFPGTLHIALESVRGYTEKHSSNAGVSIKLEINGSNFESPVYQANKNIPLDFYVKMPITTSNPINIKATLVLKKAPSLLFKGSSVPTAECHFCLKNIDPLHNRLIEMSGQWAAMRCSNIFKGVKQLLFAPEVPAGSLQLYASFIADDEVHTINAMAPHSLFTLNKWLTIYQHARNLLFAGYLSVRRMTSLELDCNGEQQMCRIGDEKKMYVKWYGFTIFLFDAFTKKLCGSINLADAELSCEGLSQGMLSFKMQEGIAQVYCDTTEKLAGCIEAMSLLFPQAPSLK
ncbi:hypothetical protein PAEPH01_1322 [Pancytospora epiphaga]|nr:hypothetical protein PAEPH01_1322 [Pancytospora epiphaga]